MQHRRVLQAAHPSRCVDHLHVQPQPVLLLQEATDAHALLEAGEGARAAAYVQSLEASAAYSAGWDANAEAELQASSQTTIDPSRQTTDPC